MSILLNPAPGALSGRLRMAASGALRSWLTRHTSRVEQIIVRADAIADPGGFLGLARAAGPGHYEDLVDAFVEDEDEQQRLVAELEAFRLDGATALRALTRWEDDVMTYGELGRKRRPTLAQTVERMGLVPPSTRRPAASVR